MNIFEMSGGITNKVLRVRGGKDGCAPAVVVRMFGNKSELMIDRSAELKALQTLAAAGHGPRVFGRFANGIVIGYLEGQSIEKPAAMRDSAMIKMIAREFAHWHSEPITDSATAATMTFAECALMTRTKQWLDSVPQCYADDQEAKQAQLDASPISAAALRAELREFADAVGQSAADIVFCHNDVLAGNVIVAEDASRVLFCDVEYGALNCRAFDIANHWCEWTGFELDATLFPSEEKQLEFCEAYLAAFDEAQLAGKPLLSAAELRVRCAAFTLASELFWSAWALVQSFVSEIDFDYLSYAIQRFQRYQARKPALLRSLKKPASK